jgi:hypothetical protein
MLLVQLIFVAHSVGLVGELPVVYWGWYDVINLLWCCLSLTTIKSLVFLIIVDSRLDIQFLLVASLLSLRPRHPQHHSNRKRSKPFSSSQPSSFFISTEFEPSFLIALYHRTQPAPPITDW